MIKFRHIVILIFALGLCSCNKVIPKQKMVDIYVDMFIADQWINDNPKIKIQADTLLIYDEVFRRHNVDYERFVASIEYYSKEIEDFSWIAESTQDKLQDLRDSHQKVYDEINEIRSTNAKNKVPYISGKFPIDSASIIEAMPIWPQNNPTLVSIPYYIFKKGYKPIRDTSLFLKDTTLFLRDTILIKKDTVVFEKDLIYNKKINIL